MSEWMEYKLELLAKYPPVPFSYDASTQLFTIGNDTVELNDFENYDAYSADPMSVDEVYELVDRSQLAVSLFGSILQLPPMYKWLTTLNTADMQQVRGQVTDTMIDAYSSLKPDSGALEKGTHWGFGMDFIRPGHPTFTVVGDCACLGVNLYGNIFDQNNFEDGLAEYGLHNIDWPAQKTALFAGAGVLAQLCEIKTSC